MSPTIHNEKRPFCLLLKYEEKEPEDKEKGEEEEEEEKERKLLSYRPDGLQIQDFPTQSPWALRLQLCGTMSG